MLKSFKPWGGKRAAASSRLKQPLLKDTGVGREAPVNPCAVHDHGGQATISIGHLVQPLKRLARWVTDCIEGLPTTPSDPKYQKFMSYLLVQKKTFKQNLVSIPLK